MNEPRGAISGAPWLDEPCERHEQQDCRECADERYQETIWTVTRVVTEGGYLHSVELKAGGKSARLNGRLAYESLGDALYPPVGTRVRLHEHDGVVDLYEVAP